jgi:hypothetical protein
MSFDVSTGAAYAVLYGVLLSFTLMAFGSAGWLNNYLPSRVLGLCLLKPRSTLSTTLDNIVEESTSQGQESDTVDRKTGLYDYISTADYYLAARNSAGPWTIALSYFASGVRLCEERSSTLVSFDCAESMCPFFLFSLCLPDGCMGGVWYD